MVQTSYTLFNTLYSAGLLYFLSRLYGFGISSRKLHVFQDDKSLPPGSFVASLKTVLKKDHSVIIERRE
jgi:hypothetical protein